MPPTFRKYLALAVVVVGLVALDQVTKQWAYRTLASEDHPLPIVVTGDEAGERLAAVVAARFPDLDDPAEVTAEAVRRVARDSLPTADQAAFAPLTWKGRTRSPLAYAFFHEGWDAAPRMLPLLEKPLLRRWLGFLFPDRSRAEVEALVTEEYQGLSLASYLAEHVAGVDAAEARAAIEAGRVLPLFSYRLGVDPDRTVAADELYLLTERRVDVIPGFFRFDYKENPGAAWGLFASRDVDFRRWFLTGVSILAAIVILVIFVRLQSSHWSAILSFSAILAGAVGNLIDRFRYNFVIDFFDMYVSYMHWPTYNVADIAITLGVVTLVVEMLFVKSSPFAETPPGAEGAAGDPAPLPPDGESDGDGDPAGDGDPKGPGEARG